MVLTQLGGYTNPMPLTIPSSAYARLSDGERSAFLEAAFAETPDAMIAYRLTIQARLRVFEELYELSSHDLPAVLKSGKLPETANVSRWLFWCEVWNELDRETRAEPAR